MNMKKLTTLGTGLLLCSGLMAQEKKGFDAGLNLAMPLESMKTLTNKGGLAGFGLEAAYNTDFGVDIPFRTGLAVNVFNGAERQVSRGWYTDKTVDPPVETYLGTFASKTSLTHIQAFGEVRVKTGIDKLRLPVGVSINKWQMKNTVDEAHATEDYPNGSKSVKGIKLGAHIGLEYAITECWTANVKLQLVEFGVDQFGTKGINPSWLQFGARYNF